MKGKVFVSFLLSMALILMSVGTIGVLAEESESIEEVLYPTDDTVVYLSSSAAQYSQPQGDGEGLSSSVKSGTVLRVAFLKFDLTELLNDGFEISSASLKLTGRSDKTAWRYNQFIERVAYDDWDEGTLTGAIYSSQEGLQTAVGEKLQFPVAFKLNTAQSADITELVTADADGVITLRLTSPDNTTSTEKGGNVYSKDAATESYRPTLTLTGTKNMSAGTVGADLDALSLPEYITENLQLTTVGTSGETTITWTSSNENVLKIVTEGDVTQAVYGENIEANVTDVVLTATATATGGYSSSKEFTVTVIKNGVDISTVDAELLTISYEDGDASVVLPTVGKYGSAVTWSSNREDVIAADGTVSKKFGTDVDVTLTATLTYEGETAKQRDFVVTVLASNELVADKDTGVNLYENIDDIKGTNTTLTSSYSGDKVIIGFDLSAIAKLPESVTLNLCDKSSNISWTDITFIANDNWNEIGTETESALTARSFMDFYNAGVNGSIGMFKNGEIANRVRVSGSGNNRKVSCDLTSLVQQEWLGDKYLTIMLSSSVVNNLKADGTVDTKKNKNYFYSREEAESTYRPKLIVEGEIDDTSAMQALLQSFKDIDVPSETNGFLAIDESAFDGMTFTLNDYVADGDYHLFNSQDYYSLTEQGTAFLKSGDIDKMFTLDAEKTDGSNSVKKTYFIKGLADDSPFIIENVSIKDENGNQILIPEANATIDGATVRYSDMDILDNAKLLLAVYKDSKLVKVFEKNIPEQADYGYTDFIDDISYNLGETIDGVKVKAFVWTTDNSIIPMANPFSCN